MQKEFPREIDRVKALAEMMMILYGKNNRSACSSSGEVPLRTPYHVLKIPTPTIRANLARKKLAR